MNTVQWDLRRITDALDLGRRESLVTGWSRAVALSIPVLVSSLLFAFSLPPVSWGPLAYGALVPWLLVLRRLSGWQGVASGLVFGTVAGLVGASWVPAALRALGSSTTEPWLGLALGSFWASGVPFAVVGGIGALTRGLSPFAFVAALSATCFAVDLARSYLPLGIPWGLLGHSQSTVLGIAQLAAVGGVPLVSALVAGTNAALAAWTQSVGPRRDQARVGVGGCAGLCVVLALFGLPVARSAHEATRNEDAQSTTLMSVQPNLPMGGRWAERAQRTNLATLAALTERELASRLTPPDLVIWPETVLTSPLEQNPELARELMIFVKRMGRPLVLGATRPPLSGRADRYRNSALWIDPERGVLASVDKTIAVPVVEGPTWPWWEGILGWALGPAASGQRVEVANQDAPLRGTASFAVALCYEVVFPGLVAHRRTPDSLAILNLANDSWFQGPAVSAQELAFSSFRAIEQRLWLVRAAHGGISAVIDPYGRIVSALPSGSTGALVATVRAGAPPCLAERAAIVGLALFGASAGAFVAFVSQRRRP